MRITVRVIPNAQTNEVVGYEHGAWKIRLNSPLIEGRANVALVTFLAGLLHCSKSEIQIKKGLKSRKKVLEIPSVENFRH